jgi:hypothetical protein
MFYPRIEVLPSPQQVLWQELKQTPPGFVLYGDGDGTSPGTSSIPGL